MKKVKGETEQGGPWEIEVPDRGWLVEDGQVVEYGGPGAFERSSNKDVANVGNQVFWTKEAAEAFVFAAYHPVEAAFKEYQEGRISQLDFHNAVGPGVANERIQRG